MLLFLYLYFEKLCIKYPKRQSKNNDFSIRGSQFCVDINPLLIRGPTVNWQMSNLLEQNQNKETS